MDLTLLKHLGNKCILQITDLIVDHQRIKGKRAFFFNVD